MKHAKAWGGSLVAGAVAWLLVGVALNEVLPFLADLFESAALAWTISVALGLAVFAWALNNFYHFYHG